MEKELIDMFMSMLQGPYYDRMVESTSAGFAELVSAGERIEFGLKLVRIQLGSSGSTSGTGGKKPFGSYSKKNENENNAIYSQRGGERNYQHQHVNAVTIPIDAPQQHQQKPRSQ